MEIELIVVGKTDMAEVDNLVTLYSKRINHYTKFSTLYLPDIRATKRLSEENQKVAEAENILSQIVDSDFVVLLDERGTEFTSIQYSAWLQKRMNSGLKRLIFIIGGPYGFAQSVYKRANGMISLSQMTFSHQIIRAIFAEQLYRAFTIIKGEPYHHA